jgi:hypothetical protein
MDPNGMIVDEDCVNDPECQIEVSINVIWDKNAFGKKGLTKAQKKKFEAEQLTKAQEDFGNSNIVLKVKYTEGEYDSTSNSFSGLDANSLNVIVSSHTPTGHAGVASFSKGDNIPLVMVNIDQAYVKNTLVTANTTSHELGHQFLGHVGDSGNIKYLLQEFSVNSRLLFQSIGVSQQTIREGLAPRIYAVPVNPEFNKPRQK